nr:helix-turn-helix transcriptional regulator [Allomuricauda sp.]
MDQEIVLLVLSCLGIAQAIFLVVYLLSIKTSGDPSPLYLALAILGLTMRIGKSIFNVYFDLEPWQRNLGLSGILLAGPFLWFYGRSLLGGKRNLAQTDYLHILPFLLFALGSYWIPNKGNPLSYTIYILVFAHLAIYIGISFRTFFQFKNKVHPQRTSWYRNLILGAGLIWLFYMGNLIGLFSFYIGGALFFSLLIYIFSFLFLQKHLFRLGKYNASTLNKTHSEDVVAQLRLLFEKEQPYLENEISLESIAAQLAVSPRVLSQAINENEQMNFSGFVNRYRIEKAKLLLSDPKHYNTKIVAIAYDCGFGNVTSFNLAFKAFTQLTPSAFRKEMQKN